MKLTSRGFTLVELMIVIAIIGILAAALFPSMTGYLKRSRDTARISNLKDITTAVGAFYADKETYPGHSAGCVNSSSTGLTSSYMPKGVPTDPQAANDNSCGSNGQYGYGSGVAGWAPIYAVVATLENPNGWNTGSIVSGITGSLTASPTSFRKGSGSGYVLTN